MAQKLNASFTELSLRSFKKVNEEITIDSHEHDFSPRFAKYFVEGVLGYQGSEYVFERGRTDITLLDENKNRAVVIETKRPKESLDAEKWRDQAGKYADASTRFVGLTNGYRILLWEVTPQERILKVDLDIKAIVEAKRASEEKLTTKETEQILFLGNIAKQQVWSEAKYAHFDEYYAKIDVYEKEGFEKLIEQLRYISNDLLRRYTYAAFDEYYAGYAQYKKTTDELEKIIKSNGDNKKKQAEIARLDLSIQGKYKQYSTFFGYYFWKAVSNRPDDKEEENKHVFCQESIYLLIHRLLFIRICEDRGLLSKKICNGGIERLREQLHEPVLGDTSVFKQIVQFSYSGAKNIYSHFYEKNNPLDWYESGDGELDKTLNKVLWFFNQFDFSKVDRDILGKLYEKYLPKEERKKLGEFYTPDEVVDYILDSVEYVPSKAIENKDLIDPACGSGGFLVRAARRLIARQAVKFGKATPKEALDNKKWAEVYARLTPKECEEIVTSVGMHIHGFDINPFAVSITEMNLLFQIIDLYTKAAKANNAFKVPRFQIYETDSLEPAQSQSSLPEFYGSTGKSLAKDKDASDELKKKKYDFVVGNPPYVRQEEVRNKKQLAHDFPEVYDGRSDLSSYFIELGIKMLKDKANLSYITSNKFMKRGYGIGIRKYILNTTSITQIIDFGDSKIFEDATNYPCIFVLNGSRAPNTKISVVNVTDKAVLRANELGEILSLIRKQRTDIPGVECAEVNQNALSSDKWQIISEEKTDIIQKIKRAGELLYPTYAEDIFIGMRTGFNDAFLVEPLPDFEEGIVKQVATGKGIEPFAIHLVKFCLYPNGNDERLIPQTIKHLSKFRQTLENRAQFKQRKDLKWFEIEQPVSKERFEKPKIITPSLSEKSSFYYDLNGLYCFNSCTMIIPKESRREVGYYLTALLNSKLLFFYLTSYSPYVQAKFHYFEPQYLKLIPIVEYDNNNSTCRKVSELSKQCHQFLKKNPQGEQESFVNETKKQIDDLVFDLYKITSTERKVIEKAVEV